MFLFRYGVNYINLAVISDIYIMPRITMTKIWNQPWISQSKRWHLGDFVGQLYGERNHLRS